MSWLENIPAVRWAEFALISATLIIGGSIFFGQASQIKTLKLQLAEEKEARAEDRATAATVAAQAADSALTESNRRLAAQAKDNQNAIVHEQDLRVAAERSAASSASLLVAAKARAVAASRRAAGGDPAAVAAGAAGATPDMVLPDVLGRVDDRAGELAKALDLAYARGQQCERAYDSLSRQAVQASIPLDRPALREAWKTDENAADASLVPIRQLVAGLGVLPRLEQPGGP